MDLFSQIDTTEREEILTLRKELEEANHQYYVLNMPTMSDYDFDQKLRRLQDLEAQYPDMFDANSPTQRVGSDIEKPTPTPSLKGRVRNMVCLSYFTNCPCALYVRSPRII